MTASEKRTLLLVDGHSLAFRAFYALPIDSFRAADGQHTNAIHGFISMLLLLLQQERPSHLAVAFDISRYSFRTRQNPEYKATRGETPAEFIGQVPLLQDALHAMGIKTLQKEDFEADDILATLATSAAAEGFKVLVVSGDRDTIQLVNDSVTLLYPNVRGVSELKRYDREAVLERYGVEPAQYPDVAALVGESSDNLIGIDKVGEKTAVKWVTKYGNLDQILAHADEITGVVGANLRAQRDRAILNRQLNRLITDVPLGVHLDDLQRAEIDVPAVREVFDRLQFRTLQQRVLKLAGIGEASETAVPAPDIRSAPNIQRLADEELDKWLQRASANFTRSISIEVVIESGLVVELGLANSEESVTAAWTRDSRDIIGLKAWLESTSPKQMHAAKAQLKALATAGVQVGGMYFDTHLASWLLQPAAPQGALEQLVATILDEHLPTANPEHLVSISEPLPPATRAWYVHRVADALREELDAGSLQVLANIELPLMPVILRMESTGIAVDRTALRNLSNELSAKASEGASAAYEAIGREVNLASPKQLQEVLFEQLGMPKTRSNKTGFSTDAAAIADLQEKNPHPFLDLLLEYRELSKMRQMVDGIEKEVGADGRIHTTFDQAGAATGRLASNEPNLQNVPARTETGLRIRAAFVSAEPYSLLMTADYSQIEMRIMAHLSQDAGLIEAFRSGEDLHRFVGARVFGVDPRDVTSAMRTKVKAMSYGLVYGLSAFGLSRQLRIDQSEARTLMNDYFARFGGVRDYLRSVVEQARVDGYTTTIFGRRRPFPELRSPNRLVRENAERQALNAPIQGSAADVIKLAMIRVDQEIRSRELKSRMLLTVHDELVFEVAGDELDELKSVVGNVMLGATKLVVPLEVHFGSGSNWATAGH